MRRSRHPFALLLGLFLLLLLALPVAAQSGTATTSLGDGRVRIAIDGDLVLPAGDTAEVVVVIDGDARIEGTAKVVTVIDGTLTLVSGATVDTVAIIRGTADIGAGATVTRDVLELDSTVTVDPAATVGGQVRSLAVDLAGVGIVLGILGLLAWAAFAILTWFAGLALAAFGSRQVRSAEWLISREPAKTFIAGIAMVLVPPIVAAILMATVVLLPVGLALLLIVWPVLAFLGWLVGSIWIGDWVLRTAGRDRPERRPYLAVTIGLVVATLLSLIPLVGVVISLFGTGAVALAGWRTFRGTGAAAGAPGRTAVRCRTDRRSLRGAVGLSAAGHVPAGCLSARDAAVPALPADAAGAPAPAPGQLPPAGPGTYGPNPPGPGNPGG